MFGRVHCDFLVRLKYDFGILNSSSNMLNTSDALIATDTKAVGALPVRVTNNGAAAHTWLSYHETISIIQVRWLLTTIIFLPFYDT